MTTDVSGYLRTGLDKPVVKYAKFTVASATTDGAGITAVAGKKIRVLSAIISGSASTAVTFNSKPAGAGTAISATFTYVANAISVIPFTQHGYFETVAGEGLTVTSGAGGTTQFQISYIEA